MQWSVLTGDIVESSEFSPADVDEMLNTLEKIAWEFSGWRHSDKDKTESAFARRGGDGWQIALSRPVLALRAALYIQARLRLMHEDATTRIAVATGEGALPENANADLNSAHGAAFRESGRLLEKLTGRVLFAHAGGGALGAAFRLADHISQGWTQAQARAVCAMLPPGSGPRRIAAEQIGISRQAVDQALWSAGYPAIEDAMNMIEQEISAS